MIEIFKSHNYKASDNDLKEMYNRIVKYDKNINDVLDNFDFRDVKKSKNKFIFPIILRTGGIGDLIALSSISYYIPELLNNNNTSIKFVSQEKYREIFDWYKRPVTFISYFSPVTKYESNNVIEKTKINPKIIYASKHKK